MTVSEIELAHWQGSTDARVDEHDRRLDAINGNIEKMWQSLGKLDRTVAGLVGRVAVAASVAALVGSGLMTIAVYFITKG